MAFLQKIGAEKVKYELNVNIHYVNAKLTNKEKLKVLAKRGRGLEETQPMQYDSIRSNVIFEYPLSFEITMHKKSEKYVRKIISFKLIELQGEKSITIGKAEYDFSDLANNFGINAEKLELPLKGCSDKSAMICVSMSLDHINKIRSHTAATLHIDNKFQESDVSLQKVHNEPQFLPKIQPKRVIVCKGSGDEEDTYDILSQSTIITSTKDFDLLIDEAPGINDNKVKDKKFISKDTSDIKNQRNRSGTVPYQVETNFQQKSVQNNEQHKQLSVEVYTSRPKSNTIADPTSPVDSTSKGDKLKWLADFDAAQKKFVDPKDSNIDSEESSSDEDLLDVSSEVQTTPPRSFMKEIKPNMKSHEKEIENRETNAGLSGPGQGSTCAACKGCILL
ncbi:unnamed protein product [Blepharisma stoltei]|uniref:C2 NT-type domain-containing protein n=1 Tax=Blepharisma stoltei TaxID=1481888 RepID=A0AAU9JHE3_9CILI|nr:unnamed protein product [Blepharisma stoltei]